MNTGSGKNYLSKVSGDSPADVLHRETAQALDDALRAAGPAGCGVAPVTPDRLAG